MNVNQTAATWEASMRSIDVTVVGAGPAGIGMALTLAKLPGIRYAVLEGDRIGESFRRWPQQTRFITPSFHSNPFGLSDLNAVDEASSPAIFTGVEHPSGEQYGNYLVFVADGHALSIVSGCKVEEVTKAPGSGFVLATEQGELHTRFLIWATGEYQFPDLKPFPGAQVANWSDFESSHHTVIGGYESGADAAIQLVRLGCAVSLLARKSTWDAQSSNDPSLSLSPYTRARLHEAVDTGRLEIVFGADVIEVTLDTAGGYRIHASDGRYWDAAQAPILGTGFLKGGGARQIADLWEWNDEGRVVLSGLDESTRTPGLFLIGPQVRHEQRIYCFIYKFRQRLALIAARIAERLEVDAAALRVGDGAWGPFGNNDCCEGCQC
ncbi:NAD(P)-binding domain-containing protein [Burkholderia pseudomallei]|nr:NAD(P)/FAD-dependent oxidoreductase [Burkholderia pseudomallei]MBM5585454.1 NAD(P)-binding domain-containing protein [Burkholderia pseudomallei]MBM5619177.1 NAD(P)-binding domain-containing protein [Burkholderia pseudomallei]MBM5628496.1 NAD(P)-binding domain-containing protein [Burkholderia pseudomallei]MBM5656754.1 NAD(P)-binding domain-containing protein [Burkholderia pseudomallei]RPA01171.1 thioredoxin reductase [Burkholderia pseudomallei]